MLAKKYHAGFNRFTKYPSLCSYNITLIPEHDKTNVSKYTSPTSPVDIYNLEVGASYTVQVYTVSSGQRSTAPASGTINLRKYDKHSLAYMGTVPSPRGALVGLAPKQAPSSTKLKYETINQWSVVKFRM